MHTFPTPGPVRLRVTVPAGAVHLAAADTDTTTVELSPAGHDVEAAAQLIERTRVEHVDDVVVVEVPAGTWFLRRTPDITARVTVPTGSDVEVRVATADVDCTGTVGDVTVMTASGDVRLGVVDGRCAVKTASGNVAADEVGRELTVSSASGDVRVGAARGDCDLRLASGDVSIDDSHAAVRAKTASGDLTVRRAVAGELALTTVSGDVVVAVAPGVPVWIDASCVTGTASSELGVSDDVPDDAGAAVTVRARSVSGDITVRRAVPATA